MDEADGLDQITRRIIGAAVAVHRVLGPGLLESAYQVCLAMQLAEQGLEFDQQVSLPIVYRGRQLDCGYRLDFIVEGQVIVEIKAIEKLDAIHHAQLLSYLRLSGRTVGLLINFHEPVLKSGVRRIVNNFPDSASSASRR